MILNFKQIDPLYIKALEALALKNIIINADLAYQSDELSKKLKAMVAI